MFSINFECSTKYCLLNISFYAGGSNGDRQLQESKLKLSIFCREWLRLYVYHRIFARPNQ